VSGFRSGKFHRRARTKTLEPKPVAASDSDSNERRSLVSDDFTHKRQFSLVVPLSSDETDGDEGADARQSVAQGNFICACE
jgi:hypothetical protein